MQDAREHLGLFGNVRRLGRELLNALVEEFFEIAAQRVRVAAAVAYHVSGRAVGEQREEQVFERDIFVPPLDGLRHRRAQSCL